MLESEGQAFSRSGPSRRELITAGMGFGLAVAGTTQREYDVATLESETRRKDFNEFVGLIGKRTNIERYYPGGFGSLTDEQLKGLFSKRELTDPNKGERVTRYSLSLPSDDVSPLNENDFNPAIEIAVRINENEKEKVSKVSIEAHFFAAETADGKKLTLFNLNRKELPRYTPLTEEELDTFVRPLVVEPDMHVDLDWTSWYTTSTRMPTGPSINQIQKDYASEDTVVAVKLEEDGEFVYYERMTSVKAPSASRVR